MKLAVQQGALVNGARHSLYKGFPAITRLRRLVHVPSVAGKEASDELPSPTHEALSSFKSSPQNPDLFSLAFVLGQQGEKIEQLTKEVEGLKGRGNALVAVNIGLVALAIWLARDLLDTVVDLLEETTKAQLTILPELLRKVLPEILDTARDI